VHLSICAHNFGMLEWAGLHGVLEEVFPGCPRLERGYVYLDDEPRLGIDLDEAQAARYPSHGRVACLDPGAETGRHGGVPVGGEAVRRLSIRRSGDATSRERALGRSGAPRERAAEPMPPRQHALMH
jgi:hypothetical protein